MRSTSGTCSSTTSPLRRPPLLESTTRRWRTRSGTSSPNAGSAPSRRTRRWTPSASTTSRWNSSSAARSPTTSRTCCWARSGPRPPVSAPWTGWGCSKRNPTRGWGTAASGAWRRAFSIPWPRCSCPRWDTGSATSTGCSGSPSTTAGSASSRTTGCAVPTPGRSAGRRRRSRSSSTAASSSGKEGSPP